MAEYQLIGEKPRPRVLVMGAGPDGWEDIVSSVTPTWRSIQQWTEVFEPEWDALISFGGNPGAADDHLDVLSFGNAELGWAKGVSDNHSFRGLTTAEILAVPESLHPAVRAAVHRTLVPVESGEKKHTCLVWGGASSVDKLTHVEPFLVASTGAVLAGRFRRWGDKADAWFLPPYAPFELWLKLAVQAWNERSPEKYPLRGAWRERSIWQTQRQRAAGELVRKVEGRRQALLAELATQEEAARSEFDTASADTETNERQLLLAQGAPLVAAVTDALRVLGFEVRDMDEVFPAGQRREDLRVTHVDRPGWEAVVEVRGYARGGGATSDLAKLQRWCHLYERDEKREPSSAWYVVNQFFESDPSERGPLLASAESDVQHLAENYQGLLIDTAELFKAITADCDRTQVARALVETVGRFTCE